MSLRLPDEQIVEELAQLLWENSEQIKYGNKYLKDMYPLIQDKYMNIARQISALMTAQIEKFKEEAYQNGYQKGKEDYDQPQYPDI